MPTEFRKIYQSQLIRARSVVKNFIVLVLCNNCVAQAQQFLIIKSIPVFDVLQKRRVPIGFRAKKFPT
jgi:hypothetical protein